MRKSAFKSFPFIEQTGMMECGTTALAMIFKYYGYYNVQRVLAQIAQVDTQGTDMYTLSRIAGNFGFATEGYQMDYEYLSEIPLPCIAHYEGSHFVVIYKANDKHVWVADPAYGKDKYTKEEFETKWNGVVLTMTPTERSFKNKDMLDRVEEHREESSSLLNKFYKPVIKPRRRLLIQILVATLLLQITGLAVPLFTQTIVDEVLVHENKRLLYSILLGMGVIFLVQILLLYIRNILLVQFKVFLEHDFFSRYFYHFISLFQRYFDRHRREDFINRFRENMRIRAILNPVLLQAVVDLVFVLGYIPLLLFYNVKLGLVAALLTGLFLLVAIGTTPKIRSLTNKVFYKDIAVLGKFLDVLLGIGTMKLLGIEQVKFMSWQNEYKRNLNTVLESEQVQTRFVTVQRAIFLFSQIAIFWLGAYWVFLGELTLGQYLACITIFMIVLNALNNLSFLWIQMADMSVSIARLNDVLIEKTETGDLMNQARVPKIESINFHNVSFKYSNGDDRLTLKRVGLTIEKGQKIGLVGRNGAGKTTLVKLLVNLYPHYKGQITLNDGLNIQSLNVKDLRRKVFLFPQDIYVFSGSIRDNILYANPSASNDDIIRAAELADLHDFVKEQHLGYNQMVGDEGTNLSGGQILKLGFARLFVSNPDVIILDEASSQLDVETEQKIMENVMRVFKDKIIISIAHRINTLRRSDKIIVMDRGEIVEFDNHDNLMAQQGLYHKFMKTYVSY